MAGLGRSKLYALVSEGDFPIPVKLGRKTVFSQREVQAWIADRLARRGGRA